MLVLLGGFTHQNAGIQRIATLKKVRERQIKTCLRK